MCSQPILPLAVIYLSTLNCALYSSVAFHHCVHLIPVIKQCCLCTTRAVCVGLLLAVTMLVMMLLLLIMLLGMP